MKKTTKTIHSSVSRYFGIYCRNYLFIDEMREIKTGVDNILSLISCAEDFGFKSNILFDAFRVMLNDRLTGEEIETFARELEAEDGYSKEDYEQVKETLTEFKNKYIHQTQ